MSVISVYNGSYYVTFQTEIEVYRKSSASQPQADDYQIDWEETVYLNLILQHVSDQSLPQKVIT